MKTITHNGQTLKITAIEERAIHNIARNGVVAVSDLSEGRGRWLSCPTGIGRIPGVTLIYKRDDLDKQLGLTYPTRAVADFFERRPRVVRAYYDRRGTVRRISAKLRALDAPVAKAA